MGNNELRLVAPEGLNPDMDYYPGATFGHDVDTAVKDADVVMALRIQRERIKEQSSLMTANFFILLESGGMVSLKNPLANTTLESNMPYLMKLFATMLAGTSR